MTTITLVAALVSFALTVGVLWINPYRFSNQVFALVTLIQTISLSCVYRAKVIAEIRPPDYIEQFEMLIRANAAVIAFLPAAIWLLKNAIVSTNDRLKALSRSLPLFVLSVVTVFVCYSESFIFVDATGVLQRGPAYYIYSAMAFAVYVTCLIQVCGQMRTQIGIRRVELQFLALNVGGAALLLVALNALGNYFEIPALKSMGLVLMFAASALTAWALLFHQVFNARELLMQLGQRISFVFVLTGGIYAIWRVTSLLVTEPASLIVSIGLFSPIAIWIDRKSRDWFESGGRKRLAKLRRATIHIASTDFETKKLVSHFEHLLRTECRVRNGTLLTDDGEVYSGSDFSASKERAAIQTAIELGWATPESLARRRPTAQLEDLRQFMATNSLGLLLSIPRGNPTPSMLIALGTRIDESPFTYPEIQRLQNVGELIGSMLIRSKLLSQTAMRALLEYFAMASRGLAHDLKNLLTPISSFLIHTDGFFPPGSREAEVHASARGATRIMTDYIREALFFADRLDPRFESVDLTNVARRVCEITALRASHREVRVVVKSDCPQIITADDVLLQRMLANLVHNAIDASPAKHEVSISIAEGSPGMVRMEVTDDGCGIPPEDILRIFDPYFTTKRYGNDVRGFGLGLTIAQKIVLLHQGKIWVRSQTQRGTIVTVELPKYQVTPTPFMEKYSVASALLS